MDDLAGDPMGFAAFLAVAATSFGWAKSADNCYRDPSAHDVGEPRGSDPPIRCSTVPR